MKMKQAAARCDEIELKKNAKEANQIERREAECKEGAKTQRVWEENCQEGKVYFLLRVDWQMQLKYNIYLGCFEFCKT